MATNILNNQLKQLKKLGKDVDDLEKKLNKVFDDVEDGKSSNGSGRNVSNIHKPSIPMPNDVMRNNQKKPLQKCQRKAKSATLEVTVKTKRHGKSSKSNASTEREIKNVSKSRNKSCKDVVPSEKIPHCCCLLNSKNMAWGNILKHSEFPNPPPNSREGRTISCEETCHDHLKGNHCENICRIKHPSLNSNKNTLQPSNDAGKEISGSDLVCNDLLNSENSRVQNIPQLSEVGRLKQQQTRNGVDEIQPVNGNSLQPIDNLCKLMEELRRTTTNQPTQTLVQEMEVALKRLCKVAVHSHEAPVKISKDTEDSNKMYSDKSCFVTNAMVQVPSIRNTDERFDFVSGRRTKEDNVQSQSDPLQNGPKRFAVAEKFELLVKVNDDDGAKRQYILGNDEKLKAEIEYLNKQLNLQLKSVEGISTKESEYHKLIASLIEKVDKLEAQVNEQTKVTQHFYGQCNTLLEQNRVIPKMQKKLDHLSKQLQDTSQNYEKLKLEYCLMKLDREKYYTLNCEKDKEISRFKEEIRKIQSLVSQQTWNVKGYAGYSSATEKVDTLLSTIDSQSHLIKSKISDTKELAGVNISSMGSLSSSGSSSESRPISPFSHSVRLSSPNKVFKSSNAADGQERNSGKDTH